MFAISAISQSAPEQDDAALSQIKPDVPEQALVPHRHAAEFGELPSDIVHGGPPAHVLLASVQNNPEEEVHPLVPHKHATSLGVLPLVRLQSGADIQRQPLLGWNCWVAPLPNLIVVGSHVVVEEVSTLKLSPAQ